MIVPVDSDRDETNNIAEENRNEWYEIPGVGSCRHFKLEHHHRNDDGDDSVGESLESSLTHRFLMRLGPPAVRTQLVWD